MAKLVKKIYNITACCSCQWVRATFLLACAQKSKFCDLHLQAFLILFILVSISFSSFSFLLAAVIDLLLDLLALKKLPRKRHRDGHFFTVEKPCVVAGNFALSFSLNVLSFFVHILGFIRLIDRSDLGIIGKSIFSSCRS